MFNAPRRPLGVLVGLLALGLTLLSLAFPAPAAPESIDQIITGAIGPTTTVPGDRFASSAFGDALDLVSAGRAAEAYDFAATFPSAVERRAAQWAAIMYGNGDVPYLSVLAFSKDAPDFAATATFKTRLEQALTKSDASPAQIVAYLSGAMPNTLDAQIALALAYVSDGQKARAARIARDIWVNDFLDRAGEDQVFKALGNLLAPEDHWARAEHLMMHDRASAVERLLPLLSPAQQSLAIARNAVSRNAANAKKLLDAVDPAYRDNPVYLFSRAQRARQFELWDDAIGFLNEGKASDPDAAEWWYERRTLIRQLLAAGEVKRAYGAAAGYTQGPEGRLVEARFHAGWIALSFLKDASAAEKQFVAMTGLSSLPDSVSQAWYWLGKSREALGNEKGAKQAFTEAARYGTIYYGLLARGELGLAPVALRDMPNVRANDTVFNNNEIVRAVMLLAEAGHADYAAPLLRSFVSGLTSGGELLLAARLAQKIDAHHLAISIADIADRRGSPLDLFSFPKDGLPSQHLAQIDKAAIYAITRQESHFQVDAVSSSGARGLMQLMPATAKETAKKAGIAYSQSRLTTDGAYNAFLGSTYLATQLASFDGSLVLAAAAYNAGAGNAKKWLAHYGDPRSDKIDPVVWIELIPFEETRRYVQRVLGNYLVYRARLAHEDMTLLEALRSING